MKLMTMTALALAAMTTAAAAHGAANWIQNGGYTGTDGKGCCGPNDCQMEMTQDVVATETGWTIRSTKQQFSQTDPRVFPSIDQHFWTCRRPDSVMAYKKGSKRVRCLFVPMQS